MAHQADTTESKSEHDVAGTATTDNTAIRPGATVKVHQVLVEKTSKGEDKKRIQVFEGMVLARKHRNEIGATITVRKVSEGVGVEKIFPLNSPWITKIEVVKQAKVRRAKLGYLRSSKKRLKESHVAAS